MALLASIQPRDTCALSVSLSRGKNDGLFYAKHMLIYANMFSIE